MAIITLNNNSLSSVTTLPSGISGQNYPAFYARMSTNQVVTDAVTTLIEFDTEVFDTDSAFNNTATGNGYSFTVPTGKDGKYYIFGRLLMSSGAVDNLEFCDTSIYVNGSAIGRSSSDFRNNEGLSTTEQKDVILDLTAGDYVQIYGRIGINSGTATVIQGSGSRFDSDFGAFRIGA